MAEYIEREAAIEYLENHKRIARENNTILAANEDAIIKFLREKCPAADVVAVRHGEWIKNQSTADVCAEYRCSLCGFFYCEADPEYPPYNYCPKCGAKNE